MIADRTADDEYVAVADAFQGRPYARQADADAGRREIQSAAFAVADDLRVAGADGHTDVPRGLCKACDDPVERLDLEALLDERVQRQVQRARTGNGKVVGRAVNGERTDVTAGKLQRLNGETVGCDHDLSAVEVDRHGIGLHIDRRLAEMPDEHRFDQFAHEATAVAVG